jgi:hypothetical protein
MATKETTLEKHTRLLCELNQAIDDSNGRGSYIPRTLEMLEWWANHIIKNNKRKAQLLAEIKTRQAKQAAISKLTVEERRLLNLNDLGSHMY